ncbi:MAG: hypothetical protein HDQ96_11805 [Lachnospiraceae bacterium]|nr:hypothetical protein [Lachnospiraceae bacterium]
MLVTKNPDFESIADALYFLTENRDLLDAYQRHEAEEAYKKYLEEHAQELDSTVQKQALALSEKDARIAELERLVAENQHRNKPHPFSKWKSLLHRH